MEQTIEQPVRPVDTAAVRRARRRQRRRRNATAYLFLLPNLVAFGIFLLLPMLWVVRQSFYEGGILGPARWVGLDNWKSALDDPSLVSSIKNTLLYAGMATPLIIIFAFVAATLLREVSRGRSFFRTLIYIPALSPFVLAALLWSFIVHPDFGLLNIVVKAVGGAPVNWLGDERLALPTVAALEVWHGVGFWALFLLGALLAVPATLYDAASLDGASKWRRLWHVTLPTMRPALVLAILLSALVSLQAFDPIFVLTDGGPAGSTETAVLYIYRSIFESNNPGLGAALSMILVLVLVVVSVVILRLGNRKQGGR